MAKRSTRFVTSIHGFRTYAKWQRHFAEFIANTEAKPRFKLRTYDYDYFPLWKFFLPHYRQLEVKNFRDFYNQNFVSDKDEDGPAQLSVVAHSFGTFIIGSAMQQYPEIKLDRLILCGSILSPEFPWNKLLEQGRIQAVRNEYGMRDLPVRFARWASRDFGPSGSKGFLCNALNFEQLCFEGYRHSDFFSKGHFKTCWLPFLRNRPSLVNSRQVRSADLDQRLLDCHEIDKQVYPPELADLPENNALEQTKRNPALLPRGLSQTWLKRNPDLYCFLVDNRNKTLGYLNALPVTKSTFEKLKKGTILDSDIEAKDVLPFSSRSEIYLYLMSVAIDPEVRSEGPGTTAYFNQLAAGLFYKLAQYYDKDGAKVIELCAVAWTDEGETLCEKILGMTKEEPKQGEPNEDRKHDKPIYSLDLKSITPKRGLYPGLLRLLELYKQK